MSPASVLIAANPYEAELFRRALVETGLKVTIAEGGEGAMPLFYAEHPLVLVVALGLFDVDPLDLVAQARAADDDLTIFLVADREGEIVDDAAAKELGATRLFLRPVDGELLADAIEKRAVEAEWVSELTAPPKDDDDDAEPLDDDQLVELEMEAEPANDDELLERVGVHRIPRAPTERIPPPPVAPPPESAPEPLFAPRDLEPPPLEPPPPELIAPMSTTIETPTLLRADDTLAEAAGIALHSLIIAPDVVVAAAPSRGRPALVPEAAERSFSDHSTVARRLEKELNAAERRLFPDSPSPSRPGDGDLYDDALGDIDLDALGVDTLPSLATEELDLRPLNGAHEPAPLDSAAPAPAPADEPQLAPLAIEAPPSVLQAPLTPPLPDENGELGATDVLLLLAGLHAAGWTGRVTLASGDGEKSIYFDGGVPVFATSSFAHDRLADLLNREGVLTREQFARARELASAGRRSALDLVELGLLKSSEVHLMLRRQLEEILYSCFAWERARFRLGPEQPASDDRVRLSVHPWALFLEGVRRKYGLERLVERVGPPDTVLHPTTALARGLTECGLLPAERACVELIDGERSIGDLGRLLGGSPPTQSLSEVGCYALAWTLLAIGVVRVDAGPAAPIDDEAATNVLANEWSAERRSAVRPHGTIPPADRAIDRDRVLAKRAQVLEGDYFVVLGLDRDANEYEIGRAYARLSAEFTPARYAEPLLAELGEALADIQDVLAEAHRVLANATTRARYRSHLPPA